MTLTKRLALLKEVTLYFVTCRDLSKGRENSEVVESALKGGVKIIQYREKNLTLKEMLKETRELRKLTDKYQALLIINDHLDLSLKCQADGIHLGQNDFPLIQAKKKAVDMIIGISCHNVKQARQAEKNGASYVNLGPVFSTQTKKTMTPPIGIDLIKWARDHLSLPFTVMGGINRSNIEKVLSAGAKKIAVVTALSEVLDIEAEAKYLINKFKL